MPVYGDDGEIERYNVFHASMLIRCASDEKMYLYDIIDIKKETGEFIGDCGITIQDIDGEMLPEIGYHIHKKYWRKGFAKEAARAVRDWVFLNTQYDIIYSYMKYTNVGSYSTALANGMKKVKEYQDPKNTISYAYAITREEWKKMKEN